MKILRNILLATAIPALSGCMVINAAVSVGGMALGGPAQYAGTAFTVCEYGYEMAVNGKSPEDVVRGKVQTLAGLVSQPEPPFVGPWETGLDRTDSEPAPATDLAVLANAYEVAGLPDREPEAPARAPELPGAPAPVLLAETRTPLAVELAAPVAAAPQPRLGDWPSLALVKHLPSTGADGGWSIRLPVTAAL